MESEKVMLKKQVVFAFLPLGKFTVNSRVNYCLDHLKTHVVNLINEGFTSGISNYDLFYSRIGEEITYNTKNVIFETNSKGLICLENEILLDVAIQQNPSKESLYGKQVNEFFGVGEFPHVTITFVRIGNQDYSFYTISR